MADEKRLIDANALAERFDECNFKGFVMKRLIETQPTVDAVEVETVKAWLYQIALNNTDNYLSDACEEIISRLDGLRIFARERKENDYESNRDGASAGPAGRQSGARKGGVAHDDPEAGGQVCCSL